MSQPKSIEISVFVHFRVFRISNPVDIFPFDSFAIESFFNKTINIWLHVTINTIYYTVYLNRDR